MVTRQDNGYWNRTLGEVQPPPKTKPVSLGIGHHPVDARAEALAKLAAKIDRLVQAFAPGHGKTQKKTRLYIKFTLPCYDLSRSLIARSVPKLFTSTIPGGFYVDYQSQDALPPSRCSPFLILGFQA
ncbi:hypothetical protein TNCV_4868061 [Trichonephila clavipes]|nr:hypothetical protein TNCV_4868061 [Trichonephila clavipes]